MMGNRKTTVLLIVFSCIFLGAVCIVTVFEAVGETKAQIPPRPEVETPVLNNDSNSNLMPRMPAPNTTDDIPREYAHQLFELSELPLGQLNNSYLKDTAYALSMQGEYESAEKYAFELFSRDKSDAFGCLLMGYVLRGRGEHSSSVAYNSLVLQMNEQDWKSISALIGCAASFIELDKTESATRDLLTAEDLATKALSGDTGSWLSCYQLACVYSIRSRMRELPAADQEQSVHYLIQAKELGMTDTEHLKNDLDLVPLHDSRLFKSFLQ